MDNKELEFLIQNIINEDSFKKELEESEPISTIHYGSSTKKTDYKDIDLFIIYKKKPSKKTFIFGKDKLIDINQTDIQDFFLKLSNWDIDYTDPILSGYTVKGDNSLKEKAEYYLSNNKPSFQALDYLKKRSIESLIQTNMLLIQTKYDLLLDKVSNNESVNNIKKSVLKNQQELVKNTNLEYALNQLSYCLSYDAAASRYEKGEYPLTFQTIINNPSNKVEELLNEIKAYQKKSEAKNFSDCINYYEKAEGLISN